ncbi:MAG: exosortase, partial [Gammaproteobacteria bacterium]
MTVKGIRPSAWVALTLLVGGVAAWPTWQGIVQQWTILDGGYSHGFLAFAVFVWLVWQQREELDTCRVRWSPLGAGIAVLLWGALVVGEVLLIEAVEQLAAFALPFAIIWALLGWQVTRLLILPAGILFTTVPVWDVTSYTLQSVTVAVDHLLLSFSDIRFHVNDVFISLEGVGTFEVANGCSGLRYFLVGLVVAQLYAALYLRTLPRRVVVIGLGVLLSLAANWLRVFIIILVGYFSDMQSGLIEDHEMFGWFLFAGMLVLFYLLALRIERSEPAIAHQGEADRSTGKAFSDVSIVPRALVLVACAGLTLASYGLTTDSTDVQSLEKTDWPKRLDGFVRLPIVLDAPLQPQWRGYDAMEQVAYVQRDTESPRQMQVFAYHYVNQRPGRELVQDANKIYDSYRWKLIRQSTLPAAHGPIGVLDLQSTRDQHYRKIAYTYRVADAWYDEG